MMGLGIGLGVRSRSIVGWADTEKIVVLADLMILFDRNFEYIFISPKLLWGLSCSLKY
jgi:hypothetical protein